MSRIQFDVLVPHAQSKQVGEVFEEALKRLVTAQRIDSAEVNINDTPRLPEGMEEQLRQTYRDEHDGHDLEDAGVYRYLIKLEGVKGSLNELGMVLAACSPLTLYCRRTGYCSKMKRHMNCLPSSRGR